MSSQPILACLVKTDGDSECSDHASIVVAQRLSGLMQSKLDICVGAISILVPSVIAPASIENMVATENARRKNTAKAVCKSAEHAQNPTSPLQSCDVVFGDLSKLEKVIVRRAKSHGIIVTETGIAADMMEFEIIQKLLFGSGRPVLVVPREFKTEFSITTILVAWDGGENATRAVWNSLPLLAIAKRVVVCCVKGEKPIEADAHAEELAESLRGMGISAEATTLELADETVANTLLKKAKSLAADVVVLGAYGHSRWREFIFGGVTRDMLRFSKIPMFMSN